MLFLLLSLFTISLVYLALYTRVKRYISILCFQGLILTGISLYLLQDQNLIQLLFILLETLVVKAVGIPVFLNYLRKRNKLKAVSESRISPFISLILISSALVSVFFVSDLIQGSMFQKEIFAVAIVCILSGLLFIVTHLNIFTHLIGYLIMENGVFLLSLAIGSEMPMLVNLSILLDICVGVFVIGIFINRIGDAYQKVEVDEILTELVD